MIGLNLKLDTSPPVENEESEPKTTWSDDLLGNTLQQKWDNWSTIRREVEEGWLQDLRAFNQQNDPDTAQLSKFHSHIYIGITRTKCLSAYSRIVDLMFGPDRHWSLSPTPVPKDEANDPVNEMFMLEMAKRAELMQTEIDDQMLDLHYEDHIKASILEGCILGTGCVKGVVPGVKKLEKWGFTAGAWDVVKSEIPSPQIGFVSVFDLCVDPYANRVEDMSGVFERHVLNQSQFLELKDDPRFDEEKIEYILKTARNGNHVALWHENTRRDIAKISDSTATLAERYDVLEYWGQVSGEMLLLNGVEGVEETEVYWANVWVCHGFTLFAKVMPMKKQRIPYNFFHYDRVPHQFWGISPGRKGRSSQLGINGVVQSLLDGMAFACAPMAEVHTAFLQDGQDPRVMVPGQVYLRDTGDPAVPAVRFFQPNIPTGQLIQMGEMFKSYIDDETALPAYTYGDQGNEINKTARGLSMQMNAAALPIKSVVKNLEDGLIHPLITSWFDWNMQWSDREDIKGDMQIDVLGTSALIAKEQKTQQLIQFLSLTANPLDSMKVDRIYLLKEAAKAMEIDPEKAIPDKMPEGSQPPAPPPNPVDIAKADQIAAQTEKLKAETVEQKITSEFSAIQAAEQIVINPGIVTVADSLLASAGYVDVNGSPLAVAPQQPQQVIDNIPQNTSPNFPVNPQSPAQGVNNGIEGGVQARATGGPVQQGKPYIVGEQGPELIIPQDNGQVLNNNQTVQAFGGNGLYGAPLPTIDNPDYDMQGYIASHGVPDQSKGQHLTDEFKLPNHITFSNQSQYNSDKVNGGTWQEAGNGNYVFTPSKHNLKLYTPDDYANYFSKYERKGTFVQLPNGKFVEGSR